MLIPFSLLLFLGISDVNLGRTPADPLFIALPALVIAIISLPLAVGLLRKKRFALLLVKLMLAMWVVILMVSAVLIWNPSLGKTDSGMLFFAAEMIVLWFFSLLYYRKRESLFD